MRKTIAGIGTLLALAACGPKPDRPAPPAKVQVTVASDKGEPQETRFPDCGDDAPPCITYDDGDQGNGIYIQMPSHAPVRLTVCDVEDYPTQLPCVHKHQDQQDRWILLTPAS